MRSLKKMTTSAILAASLLCSLPMAVVLKAKGATKTATKAKPQASESSLKASHRSSHRSSRVAVASSRKNSSGKLQTVTATKPKYHGQQSIDQARTIEIQQALIREHYLDGEPTGEWDRATQDALTRFQGANHWQTKIIPDSRALIKLGLGPSHQNLLNPESAAIAPPYRAEVENSSPGGSN